MAKVVARDGGLLDVAPQLPLQPGSIEVTLRHITLHNCITAYTHRHSHTHITYIHTHANMHTLHYITLHYLTFPYSTVHYITVQCIILQYSALHYSTVHCTTVQCIALYYIHIIGVSCLYIRITSCWSQTLAKLGDFSAYMQQTMRIQCGKQRMYKWIEMRIDKMAIWTTMNGKCM